MAEDVSFPSHPARGKGFAACGRGAAIIEFALLAIPLFTLLAAILEFSLMMFTYSVLEGATNIGSRTGKTGYAACGLSREAYIRQQVTTLSGGFLDPSLLDITMLSYGNFNDIGLPEPCITKKCAAGRAGVDYVDVNGNGQWDADQGKAGAGGPGAVVLYKVVYPWKLVTPIIGRFFSGGVFSISAIATVKNEEFPAGGGC